jgi:hypothetical protein
MAAPLEIRTTDFREEIPPAASNVMGEQHHGRAVRNDRVMGLLSLDEWEFPHVAAVYREHGERDDGERPRRFIKSMRSAGRLGNLRLSIGTR